MQSKIGGAEVTKSNVGGTVKFYEVGSVGSVGSEGMGAFISRSWILQVKSKIAKHLIHAKSTPNQTSKKSLIFVSRKLWNFANWSLIPSQTP